MRPRDGPFQPGQQINPRYTILKLLGTGGMDAVYQAFDHDLGVAVAIKVIRPSAQSDATAAKELEARFKRELVLARQVTHKYVVRIYDLGEIDGIKYLTMPFVEGETLAHAINRHEPLPLDRVIRISQQVAQGLAAAHESRPSRPEAGNIMLEKPADEPVPISGDALIMDFGLPRAKEWPPSSTSRSCPIRRRWAEMVVSARLAATMNPATRRAISERRRRAHGGTEPAHNTACNFEFPQAAGLGLQADLQGQPGTSGALV